MERSRLKLLYDGRCPLCVREMRFLMRRNKHALLEFQDIHDAAFSAESLGLTADELMARIHGIFEDGRIISGVEVFREAYRRVGLGAWLKPTGWPLLRPLFDVAYSLFARNRLRISRLFGERLEDCERCAHFGNDESDRSGAR